MSDGVCPFCSKSPTSDIVLTQDVICRSAKGKYMVTNANQIALLAQDNIGKVMIGKNDTVIYLLTAMLAGGHVLMEDVPGTGKTKLAKTLAATLSAEFKRIQFTPDLLPSDVTGLNVWDQREGRFILNKGPVFTNILLADEINRATPRTQAGLLECMEEKQVTIDGETLPLADPFFVIATQNPIETAGTFPLPEAQMDRFMMRLSMGQPSETEEIAILDRFKSGDPIETLCPAIRMEDFMAYKALVKDVYVHPAVEAYIVKIVQGTRFHSRALMGVSTRGALALMKACQALALLSGRDYVLPDDVKKLAVPVLAHRLVLSFGKNQAKEAETIIESLLIVIEAPTEDVRKR